MLTKTTENSTRPMKTCDECGSGYFSDASPLEHLCRECAHQLYGYPPCVHVFVQQHCANCGWDGSVSPYLRRLQAQRENTPLSIPTPPTEGT